MWTYVYVLYVHLKNKSMLNYSSKLNKFIRDETIREAPACRQVLPPSELLNTFHRRQTNKCTDKQNDSAIA